MRSTRTPPSLLRLDEGQVRVRRHASFWYVADSRTELLRVPADKRTDVGARRGNSIPQSEKQDSTEVALADYELYPHLLQKCAAERVSTR